MVYGWWVDTRPCTVNNVRLKKNVNIASGKKVLDTLLDEIGSEPIEQVIKEDDKRRYFHDNELYTKFTKEYTTNKELFDKVNKRFIDSGYDGVEDINDPDTDMPVILFKTSKTLGDPTSVRTGREAIADILKNKNRK